MKKYTVIALGLLTVVSAQAMENQPVQRSGIVARLMEAVRLGAIDAVDYCGQALILGILRLVIPAQARQELVDEFNATFPGPFAEDDFPNIPLGNFTPVEQPSVIKGIPTGE